MRSGTAWRMRADCCSMPTSSCLWIDRDQSMMNRRDFLWHSGGGLAGIALAALLVEDKLLAQDREAPAANLSGGLHHRARAKRVVQFFMSGAASQCDTFDYKPLLIERNGQPFNPGGRV